VPKEAHVTTLRFSDAQADSTAADALVLAVTGDGPRIVGEAVPPASRRAITDALARVGCDATVGQSWRIPAPDGIEAGSVVAVGVPDTPAPAHLREAAGAALRSLQGVQNVLVALPDPDQQSLRAVAEGALLGAHRPLRIGRQDKDEIRTITVLTTASRSVRSAVRKAAVADTAAAALARDLVNEPPVRLTPEAFASTATEVLEGLPVQVTVWGTDRLAEESMGGIMAVGQGSANPPRLIELQYSPDAPVRHLALVGKGITFDSGGLSLKQPLSMVTMKCDMAGAAAVLAATRAIAELGLPVRVSAYLACAENMPSGTAQRPGDVITMRDGTTVEVLNTDAEGRLVMADALVLASEQQPDAIIDVATLTGAQMIALGARVAAVMGNDESLSSQIVDAGGDVGEPYWPMPLPEALRSSLKSPVADLKNVGDKLGGMLVAGHFLKAFVPDDISWAHLDIAGPAFNESDAHGFTPRGGTGFAARTLIQLARSSQR
jgi:leucyl aminopeptidase